MNDRIDQLLATGEISAAAPLELPFRRFPVTGPMTASEAIADDREERTLITPADEAGSPTRRPETGSRSLSDGRNPAS